MAVETVTVTIDGSETVDLSMGYEVVGDGPRTWAITPGGRFDRNYPGVPELAMALAELGNRVLIYDRPNTGESDVCFVGETESGMQADALAALLAHLGLAPAVIVGGSGGSRVSLLAAARHPRVASGLAMWMISGGPYGLLHVGLGYCAPSIVTAWNGGMEAVVNLPDEHGTWASVIDRNPSNRERLLDQDPKRFITTMQRWLMAYCPCGSDVVPGLSEAAVQAMEVPALVVRSGESDPTHLRETSEQVARVLSNARLVEPPWKDTEWLDSKPGRRFVNWPRLAPILHDWAIEAIG
jgi:pimeloyl-ACP methyl ester carboxylesterase